MNTLQDLETGKRYLYSDSFYSGNYKHKIFLKKSVDDGSNRPKFYLSAFTYINGELRQQGYIYYYIDYETKTSSFIGLKVEKEYRNLNIGSLLISSWIDLCLNTGYDFLGLNNKQRKPFLIYLLKTYGFEIHDKSLYETRDDVISICKSINKDDKNKYLLFKNPEHENIFIGTNTFKNDNYIIVHNDKSILLLDKVIIPFQNRRKNKIDYTLLNQTQAETKAKKVLLKHKI